MILYYILLSVVNLALGLYTRFAEPPIHLKKWLLPKRAWFSNIYLACAWAGLAIEEYVKATWPRFYSAHEMVFFGTYVGLALVTAAVWIAWNNKHEKALTPQSTASEDPHAASRL